MEWQNTPKSAPTRLRCAIYTRKSTEEGLDQDFNSLDAQRDAAEAFIAKKREGWLTLPARYDDGGFTGANMDRPALTCLLEAVERRELDCVVVYKVDRLSRSLLDFTRILSLFEKHGVSFVAVTQQFNTQTSLGRLTLNILLSFAQFERELIGERTRDKMSAAKKKGKWVGGFPVLGYDVDPAGGKLIVNDEEAKRVREIFAIFADNGSARWTLAEIDRRGWTLKSWTRRTGKFRSGSPFSMSTLKRLLTNSLYTGVVQYKDRLYTGEHDAIVDPETWSRVQSLIHRRQTFAKGKLRNSHLALLNGLLYCEACSARMVYSYSIKNNLKYSYYVCANAKKRGWSVCPAKTLPAKAIEDSVASRLREEQGELFDPGEWQQMDRMAQLRTIQDVVKRVGYDHLKQQISITFHEPEPEIEPDLAMQENSL
jgi:site-specific DNA recombinase